MVKLTEAVLMALAALGFLLDSTLLLFAVLFGLGVQATFFGPLKNAILPSHLPEDELLAGNGLLEAGTFLGILVGTLAGSWLFGTVHGRLIVSLAGGSVALAGIASAVLVPRAPASAPDLPIGWNPLRDTVTLVADAHRTRAVWLCILGLSWFWAVGAVVLTELPTLVRALGAQLHVFTLLLAFFSVGIAVGSVSCSRLLRGEVSARLVPFAALGLSVFIFDFAAVAHHAQGLVLLTTQRDATTGALLAQARTKGSAEIAVPRSVRIVDALPLLGTGKVDYVTATRTAAEERAAA